MAFLGALGGILSSVATIASTGLSIASQFGAFGNKGGSDKSAMYLAREQAKAEKLQKASLRREKAITAEEEKKKKLFAWRMGGGRSGSILTSGQGVTGGNVLKSQLGA